MLITRDGKLPQTSEHRLNRQPNPNLLTTAAPGFL